MRLYVVICFYAQYCCRQNLTSMMISLVNPWILRNPMELNIYVANDKREEQTSLNSLTMRRFVCGERAVNKHRRLQLNVWKYILVSWTRHTRMLKTHCYFLVGAHSTLARWESCSSRPQSSDFWILSGNLELRPPGLLSDLNLRPSWATITLSFMAFWISPCCLEKFRNAMNPAAPGRNVGQGEKNAGS